MIFFELQLYEYPNVNTEGGSNRDSSGHDLYILTLTGTLPLKHSVMGTCTSVQYTAVEESSHQKYNDLG